MAIALTRSGTNIESSLYIITIIIDLFHKRSDNYIKGLLAHELAEMSYKYRLVQEKLPELIKMKPKARAATLANIDKQNAPPGSPEYLEHENRVNQEAIRLGFSQEIKELDG